MQVFSPLPRWGLLLRSVVGALLTSILIVGAFGSSSAHAAGSGPSFTLQPVVYDPARPVTKSYFVFDSHPGAIVQDRLRVTNSGTETGSVSLYAVDATTGQTSGTVYLSHHDARHDVGAWITLGMQQLTLAPGRSQIVPFRVAIPSGVRSGQHVGGIVAESLTLQSSTGNSHIHVNVQHLTIIAVQVDLPGALVEQLEATGIQSGGDNGYQNLLVRMSNSGTVMLKPYGSLQVTDAQGRLLQNLPLKLDTFLPQTAINYPLYITGRALGAGDYRAMLTLTYGHAHVLHYTTVFTITEQQLKQVFKSSPPPQVPWLGGNFFDGLPLWQMVLFGVLLLSGMFFWSQKLYHFVSRRRGSRKGET